MILYYYNIINKSTVFEIENSCRVVPETFYFLKYFTLNVELIGPIQTFSQYNIYIIILASVSLSLAKSELGLIFDFFWPKHFYILESYSLLRISSVFFSCEKFRLEKSTVLYTMHDYFIIIIIRKTPRRILIKSRGRS